MIKVVGTADLHMASCRTVSVRVDGPEAGFWPIETGVQFGVVAASVVVDVRLMQVELLDDCKLVGDRQGVGDRGQDREGKDR